MVNDTAKGIFMDALTYFLADVDDNKKHDMSLLMKNVVVEVVKGGRIQALIGRLAARAVSQEDVLYSLDKRLSEKFLDKEEIMSVLVKRFQYRAENFITRSVNRAT